MPGFPFFFFFWKNEGDPVGSDGTEIRTGDGVAESVGFEITDEIM